MSRDGRLEATYYPSRAPATLGGFAGLLAIAAGVWGWLRWGPAVGAIVAGAGLLMIGAGIVWLLPSRSYLHLGARGFSYSTAFNPRRVDWHAVARFGVGLVDAERRVCWDYVPSFPAEATARASNSARFGFEAALPRCCSATPEALADALERARLRSIEDMSAKGSPPPNLPAR